VRIGIVNDVPMAAENLRRVISGMPDHTVAWIACDGAQAVQKCKQDTPDLVLMDLIMPVLDGVEATRRIMAATPCPILVVTAAIDSNSSKVFEALGAGALDAIQTPQFGDSSDGAKALKFKIEALRQRTSGHSYSLPLNLPSGIDRRLRRKAREPLVAIGASAGGPSAIAAVLSNLPRNIPSRVVIIQHIDAQFAPSMVGWLNEHSRIPVRIARQGDRPEPGTALMAGTNDHLAFVSPEVLGYTAEPRSCSYRPSVDVFFESIVRYWKGEVIGILLSGMGRDGAQGLKSLRNAGAMTIAQDSATCAVYGMPKAAAELKAASTIVPVEKIAGILTNLILGPSIEEEP
jgi:two-component system response regulator WspF